jgi:cysteine desulfurase / selenocysteine lyase
MTTHPAAIASGPGALDAHALRADFPIFEREINGHPLAYLDSANSTQKPRAVLDAMDRFYSTSYANVHRGVYTLGVESTEAYEGARRTVQRFLGASSGRECIFTRNASEALNLVAYAYGRKFVRPGDVVVATEMEHHSNLVPWQFLASKVGARMRYLHLTEDGRLDLGELEAIAAEGDVKIVAAVHQSNSLGTLNPIRQLSEWAHAHGAVMVCDGAQSAPHRPVDVTELGCDFFAISGHKLCGPSGAGALWGRAELLDAMDPFLTGGEMISSVTLEKTSFNELPWKFEAGTPAIAEAVGMAAAIDYLTAIGLDTIWAHEQGITSYAYERLAAIDGVHILGPPADERGGAISFTFAGIHPHDVAHELDRYGVCVRAGHHCTQPAMRRYGVAATTRASFYLYTIPEEIDRLCDGLERVREAYT